MEHALGAVIRSIVRYLRGEEDSLVIPWFFNGVIVMAGGNWTFPNAGVGIKLGCMHRIACFTG